MRLVYWLNVSTQLIHTYHWCFWTTHTSKTRMKLWSLNLSDRCRSNRCKCQPFWIFSCCFEIESVIQTGSFDIWICNQFSQWVLGRQVECNFSIFWQSKVFLNSACIEISLCILLTYCFEIWKEKMNVHKNLLNWFCSPMVQMKIKHLNSCLNTYEIN